MKSCLNLSKEKKVSKCADDFSKKSVFLNFKWRLKKREFGTEYSFKNYSSGVTFNCELFLLLTLHQTFTGLNQCLAGFVNKFLGEIKS
jgi:hypothetical protein